MCGIIGVKSTGQLIDHAVFNRMRDSFECRGPDDADSWFDPKHGLALGHRRLSIIDPRPSGRQPMVDEATGNQIVFNGEVYNYLEIKERLQKKGVRFVTETDTEVILKAYRQYGRNCLAKFNGMFAFAIWDVEKKELFLARDRIGIKPLYYLKTNKDFIFASEVKAIKKYARDLTVEYSTIESFMLFGYVPGEDTMLNGVKRLLPGHCATYKDNELRIEQFWQLDFGHQEDRGFKYYHDECKKLLLDSIRLRLRSDVPLGIFLSGGIDSSAVVGLLADKVSEPLKTFSVAYDFGEKYNETRYARMVSKAFATDHREIFVSPEDFRDFIPEYVYLMDEPVIEAPAISLYFVSKLAKEYVTVVLSGEGSDEIFGGYDIYRYMKTIEKIRGWIGGTLSYAAASLIKGVNIHSKLNKYAGLLAIPLEKRYRGNSTSDFNIKERLFSDGYNSQLKTSRVAEFVNELFGETNGHDCLSRMLFFDTKTWLVDDLLIKADRMSMAASLELRVPFLDHRLVEFVAAMPSKYKVAKNQGKFLLKKMMTGLLPNEIIHRKKMGFPAPLSHMFKTTMRDYSNDRLLAENAKINGVFNSSKISKLLNEHQNGEVDHHIVLFHLIILEEWLQQNG